MRDVQKEWLELASRVPGTSYFQTPDWVVSWWETIGGKPRTELALWRNSSGALEGVVYLSRLKQRIHPRLPPAWTVWTVTGSGAGDPDHIGWPVLPPHREAARRYVTRRTRGSTLLLQCLDPETGMPFVPPRARFLFRNPCPRVPLTPPEDVGPDVRRTRSHLRRYEKRAEAAGIAFQWIRIHEMDGSFIERLFALHTLRMAEKGVTSAFPSTGELQRRLIAGGSAHRGPIAMAAERDRRMVGVLYFLRWGDTIAYYQTGWDPGLARMELGKLLFNEAIKGASAEGLRTLDLLRGNEEYKYRLGGVDRWDETWVLPGGASGQLLKILVPAYRFATRGAWTGRTSNRS